MKYLLTTIALTIAMIATNGCITPGSTNPYGSVLQDGPAAVNGGKDLKAGKTCALVAFNTFVYNTETTTLADDGGREKVTAEEMRDLTDAMLQTFLSELSKVDGLQVKPLAETAADKSFKRFPGRPGSNIKGFALNEAQGLMTAPQNLKYFKLASSQGTEWIRKKTQGMTFSAMLGKVLGATSTDGVEHEDASLLSYRLKTDFVLMVNNRVRLVRGGDDIYKWTAKLEMVEVLVAGTNNLKKYAYAKHVTGDFADGTSAPETDPLQPAVWKLMAWKPDGKIETRTAEELTKRDFATSPFWRPIAVPYKRIASVFRDDLNKIRR